MTRNFFGRIEYAKFAANILASGKSAQEIALAFLALSNGDPSEIDFINQIEEDAKIFREKKKMAGQKGGKAKASSAKHCSSKTYQNLPNSSSSSSISRSISSSKEDLGAKAPKRAREKKIYPKDSLPYETAAFLKSYIVEDWNPDARISEAQLQSWADTARKMIEIDGRTQEDINALLNWIDTHNINNKYNKFRWRNNIRSMDKLRSHWNSGKFNEFTAMRSGLK